MSRASDCRDAIIAAIKELMAGAIAVEAFTELPYDRSELKDKPIAIVRFVDREIEIDQGYDRRLLTLQVGLCGLKPTTTNTSSDTYRASLVAAADAFDSIFEQILALWTPDGPLRGMAMADHRFDSIDDIVNFEFDTLHSKGIYLSLMTLRYFDCLDE